MFILYREVSEFFALIFYLNKNYIFLYKENRWPMTASFREKRIYRYLAGIQSLPQTYMFAFENPPPPRSEHTGSMSLVDGSTQKRRYCVPTNLVCFSFCVLPPTSRPPTRVQHTHTHIWHELDGNPGKNWTNTYTHTHTSIYQDVNRIKGLAYREAGVLWVDAFSSAFSFVSQWSARNVFLGTR